MALSLATVGAKITATFMNLIVARVNRVGLTAIIATGTTGSNGTVTIGSDGWVTFSASSVIRLQAAFFAEFPNYRLLLDIDTCSVAGSVSMNLATTGGAVFATAASFVNAAQINAGTTYNAGFTTGTDTVSPLGHTNTAGSAIEAEIHQPFMTSVKRIFARSMDASGFYTSSSNINTVVSFGDVQINLPGTAAGRARILGYN